MLKNDQSGEDKDKRAEKVENVGKADNRQQPDRIETELQQQIGELTEALQRERADAVNLRRRHEADVAGMKTRTKANVIRELLPVIDNFERALKHVPEELESNDYIKGVRGVVKQFEKTLAEIGVERIKTTGESFDPRYHEAVSMEEGEGTQEVVTDELQSGYRIGQDIIRHAMVKVHIQ